jgi:lipopolysaccharide/colanic/teichoic acid biosynthesis glycosyltransferase
MTELSSGGDGGATAADPERERAAPTAKMAIRHNLHSVSRRRFLAKLRYQLLFGLPITGLLPTVLYNVETPELLMLPSSIATCVGGLVAFLVALYLFRRADTLPGVGVIGHVLPAAAAAYGVVVVGFFMARLDYSRVTFFMSYIAANLFLLAVSTYLRRRRGQTFFLVPSPRTAAIPAVPHVDWIMLDAPVLPKSPNLVLIADLRADLSDDWERLIAQAAVAGHPVYHVKQVMESLTGRVDIEHLSENSFGSLIPDSGYGKIKRVMDLITAPLALVLLLPAALLVAIAVKLDSPGPVFFRQERRGYRGQPFEVLKFRTMRHRPKGSEERTAAITVHGDNRITKLGYFLRRTRIDELPQMWNIIKGEMSWIGPRPEAMALSDWYMAELPFYSYRHIVRPGITGWAQVNQGHVAELDDVRDKLYYDFFYIKNFSAWLDLLIVGKTLRTVITGYGSK